MICTVGYTVLRMCTSFFQSVYPNMYDSLAAIHQGANVPIAHFGPNFLSWHRIYLLM